MKITLLLILLIGINPILFGQNLNLGSFPSKNDINNKPVMTSDLLASLNWKNLKDFCSKNEGHFIYESQISNSPKETKNSYFDKNVWLEYVHTLLPNLADSLKLKTNESKNILKGYYSLIGADTRDEYGWICEYSTVPSFTERRRGVIELLKDNRTDLLKPLIKNPNLEISMYAIDAMIYHDKKTKQTIINEIIPNLTKLTRELDSLKSNNFSGMQLATNPKEIGYLKTRLAKLRKQTLDSEEWQYICELRDNNLEIRTCKDGTGSFKIYENCTNNLLSETSILEIIEKYEKWEKLGYLD